MTEQLPDLSGAAVLLVAVRLGVALRLVPVIGRRPLPLAAWAVIVAALVPLVLLRAPIPDPPVARIPSLALMLAGEAVIGACLGLLVRLALAVFEIAGAAVAAAGRVLPGQGGDDGEPAGPYLLLFTSVGMTVFFVTGGHRILIAALAGSFALLPAGALPGSFPTPDLAAALLGGAFVVALAVAGPVFVAGLAVDLSIALLARAEPAVATADAGAAAARSLVVNAVWLVLLGAAVALAVEAAQEGIAGIGVALAGQTS